MPVNNGYDGPATLAAGANRVLTILRAAGYAGRLGFTHVTIRNQTGATIYCARRSDVDATNGRPIEDGESYTWPSLGKGTHDFYQMYIYSAAGGTIQFDVATR